MAITKAMSTSHMNSLQNNRIILYTDAPNTFLIPTSLMRCMVINKINPYKPMQLMKMPMPAKSIDKFDSFFSSL